MQPNLLTVGELMRAVAISEVLPKFRNLNPNQINEKDFGELVTDADLRAEEVLERELRAMLPGSRVIGEEMIIVRNQISQEEAKYSPRLFKK